MELFKEDGPFAILPKYESKECSVIWNTDSKKADEFADLPKEILSEIISDKLGGYLGDIEINSKIQKIPLSLRYVEDYFYKRIVFVGDALHSIHPIAGQGLNLSIQDIDCLGDILHEEFAVGSDLGSWRILNKFQKQRKFKNWQIIQITDKLNWIYKNQSLFWNLAKDYGSILIDNSEFIKNKLIKYAMNIKNR